MGGDGDTPRCPRCFSCRCELHDQEPPLRTYGCCLDCGKVGDVTAFIPPKPVVQKGLSVKGFLAIAQIAAIAEEGRLFSGRYTPDVCPACKRENTR